MVSDATTFALSFGVVFGAILWGLWRMETRLNALADRLDVADAATTSKSTDGDEGA